MEKKQLLDKALEEKGYTLANVFISNINITNIDENTYNVSVYRWNTSRSWVVELTATFDEKNQRFKISYHKKGRSGDTHNGAPSPRLRR